MSHDTYDDGTYSAAGHQSHGSVGPKAAVRAFFKNYAQFKGYSIRGEFWWPWLMLFLVHLVLGILTFVIVATAFPEDVVTEAYNPAGQPEVSYQIWFEGAAGVVVGIAAVVHLIIFALTVSPLMAVTWRRFHDAGMPGPLFFLWFIPLVGWIIVLIMLAMPSKPHKRRPEWEALTPVHS